MGRHIWTWFIRQQLPAAFKIRGQTASLACLLRTWRAFWFDHPLEGATPSQRKVLPPARNMQPFEGLNDQPKKQPSKQIKATSPTPSPFWTQTNPEMGAGHGPGDSWCPSAAAVSIPAYSRSRVSEKEPLVVLRSTHLKWWKGNKGTSQNQSPLQVGFRFSFFPPPATKSPTTAERKRKNKKQKRCSTTRRRRTNRAEGAPGL